MVKLKRFDWTSLVPQPVIGVDEVGRGCLAGPVYAAAAIVPPEHIQALRKLGVTDSKLLTAEKRARLTIEILRLCRVGVGFATHDEIDEINILQASFLAMKRAILELQRDLQGAPFGLETAHILIDGNQRIPMRGAEFEGLSTCSQTTLIKGDLRALPIAAASIVAKVTRDQMMTEAAREFPVYGFEQHKGYAALNHRKAIEEHGPSRIHRKSFSGVREFLARTNS